MPIHVAADAVVSLTPAFDLTGTLLTRRNWLPLIAPLTADNGLVIVFVAHWSGSLWLFLMIIDSRR